MDGEYRFKIDDSYTPATLPMGRLAEYIAALSRLLGDQANVHFRGVEQGSAVLVANVDAPAQPKVRDRLQSVRNGIGPKDALKAFADLDELLRKDNAVGSLTSEPGALIISFPGRTRPEPETYGPFRQDGSLDGQVIRVGGKDETVPVHLRDGDTIHTGLHTTPEIARRIAQHYLGATLRVRGTGLWFRDAAGAWELKNFKITDFEVLNDATLAEVVAEVRKVKGSEWNTLPDPLRALLEERHGKGRQH